MNYTRKTLADRLELTGRGLHTGVDVKLVLHPGEEGIGFRYMGERVAARPENVTDTTRSTKLGPIGTIEHLMSALAGLEITDVEVELSAPELPGLDGSALGYVQAIQAVGLRDLGEAVAHAPFSRVFLQEDDGTKVAVGKGAGHWRYCYRTGARWPGEQAFESEDTVTAYATEIAPARTFALEEELPMIRQYGLGQGLDETSAVIVGTEGYVNAVRFEDELARHKLLDCIGDLYLAGLPIRALNVVAEKSGHRTNVKVAAMLAEAARRQE